MSTHSSNNCHTCKEYEQYKTPSYKTHNSYTYKNYKKWIKKPVYPNPNPVLSKLPIETILQIITENRLVELCSNILDLLNLIAGLEQNLVNTPYNRPSTIDITYYHNLFLKIAMVEPDEYFRFNANIAIGKLEDIVELLYKHVEDLQKSKVGIYFH
jgi:hypothetical protein